MQKKPPRYSTVREFADTYRMSLPMAYGIVRRSDFPAYRPDGTKKYLIDSQKADVWMRKKYSLK